MHETTICATTDANGDYELTGVPANVAEGIIMAQASGFRSTALLGSTTEEDGVLNFVMPSDAVAEALAGLVNVPWPDTENGVISFEVFTSATLADGGMGTESLSEVSVALDPADGTGPFYTTAQQLPDTSLTETTESNLGFFATVPPGDYTMTFTHATNTSCVRNTGWESSTANSVKVRSLAGVLTSGSMICD